MQFKSLVLIKFLNLEIFLLKVSNESDLKKIANERQRIKREIDLQMVQKTSLDSISAQIKEGDVNNLNIIIKADSDGSIEALNSEFRKN